MQLKPLFVLVSLMGFFSVQSHAQQTYIHKDAGFSILIPKGWEVDRQGKMFLYLQSSMTPQGGLRCNININVELLNGDEISGVAGSRAQARHIASNDFNALYMNSSKVLIDQAGSVGGKPGYVVMLQGKNYLTSEEGGIIYQAVAESRSKSYGLQLTCPDKSYNHFYKAIKNILDSFKIF